MKAAHLLLAISFPQCIVAFPQTVFSKAISSSNSAALASTTRVKTDFQTTMAYPQYEFASLTSLERSNHVFSPIDEFVFQEVIQETDKQNPTKIDKRCDGGGFSSGSSFGSFGSSHAHFASSSNSGSSSGGSGSWTVSFIMPSGFDSSSFSSYSSGDGPFNYVSSNGFSECSGIDSDSFDSFSSFMNNLFSGVTDGSGNSFLSSVFGSDTLSSGGSSAGADSGDRDGSNGVDTTTYDATVVVTSVSIRTHTEQQSDTAVAAEASPLSISSLMTTNSVATSSTLATIYVTSTTNVATQAVTPSFTNVDKVKRNIVSEMSMLSGVVPTSGAFSHSILLSTDLPTHGVSLSSHGDANTVHAMVGLFIINWLILLF
ncbi:unnamed protein product [Ambrosiozyma monospora]|uniref:Unnamed protein product n=1 Tax=Ambrosiozyma monospora TaxID=43982 RepID=A0A9W7DI92_AMBMO|nr:unnamed protein product [Ambrosiozyma monospora]